MEADCFWCLGKLLDQIQDHYTYAQPGIQRKIFRLKELTRRIDEPLAAHLEGQGLDFLQFAFRWVNCLLVRELPFAVGVRLWDTYIADGQGFGELVVYVALAFLLQWSKDLQPLEFPDLVQLLQASGELWWWWWCRCCCSPLPLDLPSSTAAAPADRGMGRDRDGHDPVPGLHVPGELQGLGRAFLTSAVLSILSRKSFPLNFEHEHVEKNEHEHITPRLLLPETPKGTYPQDEHTGRPAPQPRPKRERGSIRGCRAQKTLEHWGIAGVRLAAFSLHFTPLGGRGPVEKLRSRGSNKPFSPKVSWFDHTSANARLPIRTDKLNAGRPD